jgi:uncharacterized protein with PIN domain
LRAPSKILPGRTGARHQLDCLAECLQIEIVQHDHIVVELAREAFLRVGRGRRSARPDRGNFASYELAKTRRNLFLFKDPDVAGTGGTAAVAAPPA